jgi:hypothetical protein
VRSHIGAAAPGGAAGHDADPAQGGKPLGPTGPLPPGRWPPRRTRVALGSACGRRSRVLVRRALRRQPGAARPAG